MKAIMISIKPKWCAKIMNGEKTIEIRKTVPKCELPIDVYVYCTKGKNELYVVSNQFSENGDWAKHFECCKGKVVAKFTLNKVEEIICRPICGEWESYTKTLGYSEISQASCLENREIVHYLKGKLGYAWHISNLVIFDKPKELSEFSSFRKPYWNKKTKEFVKKQQKKWGCRIFRASILAPLTKAPQSFCYIEVEDK